MLSDFSIIRRFFNTALEVSMPPENVDKKQVKKFGDHPTAVFESQQY